jgi:hypothetical protein
MARTPGLLRVSLLSTLVALSGCASWHYRKDDKARGTASSSGSNNGETSPLVQGLSNASLHGWNFNSRW